MYSEVTRPLAEGQSVSFPEFAARTARIVGPWIAYERDAALDTPLPDEFVSDTAEYREKRLFEDASELGRVVLWTEEEADAQAHQRNLEMLKAHLQIKQSARRDMRTYEFMSAQVADWVAPSEDHEGIRTVMQSQLDETYKFTAENVHSEPPAKLTGQEYRAQRIEYLAQDVQRDITELTEARAQVDHFSDYAHAFKESLEGWENVPVPRRVLP